MKKKPTSNEGAPASDEAAANAPTGESNANVASVEETSPFITPSMASCRMFAGDPTSVAPEDDKK